MVTTLQGPELTADFFNFFLQMELLYPETTLISSSYSFADMPLINVTKQDNLQMGRWEEEDKDSGTGIALDQRLQKSFQPWNKSTIWIHGVWLIYASESVKRSLQLFCLKRNMN